MTKPIAFIVLLSLVLSVTLHAERATPRRVRPISRNGVVYTAPNKNGRIAYVVAADEKSGKMLWTVEVFRTDIDPKLEEDVQWVFITSLKLSGHSLLVKDERSRCWTVDLRTKKVSLRHLGC